MLVPSDWWLAANLTLGRKKTSEGTSGPDRKSQQDGQMPEVA
jgi:hypothetical protein